MSYDPKRVASAPYNFVPIYGQVVWAPPCLPRQDRYDPQRHTGHLDVKLETLAPLFIRGPLSVEKHTLLKRLPQDIVDLRQVIQNHHHRIGELKKQLKEEDNEHQAERIKHQIEQHDNQIKTCKDRIAECEVQIRKLETDPEPYHHGDRGQPVLPSASLVGMLRNVVAAASAGRLGTEHDAPVYFRNFMYDLHEQEKWTRRVRRSYAHATRVVTEQGSVEREGDSRVRAGYLIEGGKKIRPAEHPVRGRSTPKWQYVFNQATSPSGDRVGSAAKVQATWWRKNRKGRGGTTIDSNSLALNPPPRRFHHNNFKPSYTFVEYRHSKMGRSRRDRVEVVRKLTWSEFCEAPSDQCVGCLAFSGNMKELEQNDNASTQRRNAAFVLRPSASPSNDIDVPSALLDRLVEKHATNNQSPYSAGSIVKNGRPVFYVEENSIVTVLGLSPMLTVLATKPDRPLDKPVPATPYTIQPPAHKPASKDEHDNIRVDFAEALFGFASDRGRDLRGWADRVGAYRKRVSVEDAFLKGDPKQCHLTEKAFVPRQLAEPKPSYYPTYLDQLDKDGNLIEAPARLRDYASAQARPRGFKRYWHQGPEDGRVVPYEDQSTPEEPRKRYVKVVDLTSGRGESSKQSEWERFAKRWKDHLEEPDKDVREAMEKLHDAKLVDDGADGLRWETTPDVDPDDVSQHTLMRPLRPGLTFSFRIHFENLSHIELGALLWAIEPRQPDPSGEHLCLAHHLGMGKPLGMGSVRLKADLTLTDRDPQKVDGRYEKLFAQKDDGPLQWHLAEKNEEPVVLSDKEGIQHLVGYDEHGRGPVEAFQHHVLHVLNKELARYTDPMTNFEQDASDAETFDKLPHVEALLRMMAWPGLRAAHLPPGSHSKGPPFGRIQREGGSGHANTRYMQIEVNNPSLRRSAKNEYNTDPVLPPATDDLFEVVEERSQKAYKTKAYKVLQENEGS